MGYIVKARILFFIKQWFDYTNYILYISSISSFMNESFLQLHITLSVDVFFTQVNNSKIVHTVFSKVHFQAHFVFPIILNET